MLQLGVLKPCLIKELRHIDSLVGNLAGTFSGGWTLKVYIPAL
jgi:hypothetical protein